MDLINAQNPSGATCSKQHVDEAVVIMLVKAQRGTQHHRLSQGSSDLQNAEDTDMLFQVQTQQSAACGPGAIASMEANGPRSCLAPMPSQHVAGFTSSAVVVMLRQGLCRHK